MLKCRGFTLIEVLVSLFIIVLISGIIFANYRQSGQQFALQRSANKLAQDIRRAQQMAISASECPTGTGCAGQVPSGGYGVYFKTSPSSWLEHYHLFADMNDDQFYDPNASPQPDALIEDIYFENGVRISALSQNPLGVVFTPPDPKVTIFSSAAAGSITLISTSGQTKTISVNEAGLIEVE